LVSRGATLVRRANTIAAYRLFLLPNTVPAKPGLVRTSHESGAAIEIEVWEIAAPAFGTFVAGGASPLCIGSVLLEDGESVHGFLGEPFAVAGALDISQYGGWRAYLKSAAMNHDQAVE